MEKLTMCVLMYFYFYFLYTCESGCNSAISGKTNCVCLNVFIRYL